MKRQNYLDRVKAGFKAGWAIEVLPQNISNLDNNLYTRIFKGIGGICMFIVVSGIASKLNSIYFYIAAVLSLLYIIYKLVITFYAIKQWFYNLRAGNFLHRNSPLDMTATLIRVATASLKSATKFTAGTGFTYALCYELDEILEKEGKQPYFVPGMRRVVASTGMEDHAKAFLNRLGIKDKVNPEVLNSQIDNVSDEDKKVFEAETKVSWDEYVKLHK